MTWNEIREVLETFRSICRIEPISVETHDLGLSIAQRYGFSLYDSMILAAALLAECRELYSEDLQHGQRIENQVTVVNPFKTSGGKL